MGFFKFSPINRPRRFAALSSYLLNEKSVAKLGSVPAACPANIG